MTASIVHPTPRIIAVGKIANGSIETRTGPTREYQDAYTLGRSRYVSGQRLEDCTCVAERCGYTSAEADGRRADLRAMLAISFDEWQANRDSYDDGAW